MAWRLSQHFCSIFLFVFRTLGRLLHDEDMDFGIMKQSSNIAQIIAHYKHFEVCQVSMSGMPMYTKGRQHCNIRSPLMKLKTLDKSIQMLGHECLNEDLSLWIESFVMINLCGVPQNYTLIC